ncbi:MAG TPA: ETEC_3214 domain-containing protein [Streptosporangiaceae bacterium]
MKLASAEAILGLAAAIVAIGGGVLAAYRGLAALYGRTVGSRRSLDRRLNQLAAGVTTRWVENRLGAPAFARWFPQTGDGLRELVYRGRHAWVQVLADGNDAVVRFSITVTDPRFQFQVSDLTSGHLVAKLGRTTFSGLQAQLDPQGHSFRSGAHNFEYAEAYWFGNPGNYQWYVLSYNDAGTGRFDVADYRHLPWRFQNGILRSGSATTPEFDPHSNDATRFRAKTTINTLTILGPTGYLPEEESLGGTSLAEPRGPDSSHVRVLVPDARERRQRRRRVRRWNRRMLREVQRQAEESIPTQTSDTDEQVRND